MTEGPEGLLLVDKPAGCTSHDVVGRLRWLLGTRRVGHAGTLDPLATGLLVVGVGRATKLLGRLALSDKTYAATIRLGQATRTDDADGEPTGGASAADLNDSDIRAGITKLTGAVRQRPSAVSAIKVDGRRAYQLVRDGVEVELAARSVTVARFDVRGPLRRTGELVDLDVEVTCSTGTYIRALARDLGAGLGVGGHLTALRRTSSGPFDMAGAVDVYGPAGVPERGRREPRPDDLAASIAAALIPVADAVRRCFPVREVGAEVAADLRHGRPIPAVGTVAPGALMGVYDGPVLLALVAENNGWARPELVWSPA